MSRSRMPIASPLTGASSSRSTCSRVRAFGNLPGSFGDLSEPDGSAGANPSETQNLWNILTALRHWADDRAESGEPSTPTRF